VISYSCGLCKSGDFDLCFSCHSKGVICGGTDHVVRPRHSTALWYQHDEQDEVTLLEHRAAGGSSGSGEGCFRTLRDSLICRTWFLTSRSHVGCGPALMQVGDVVAVLFGARVPFVLRQQQDGRYRLIGDCYVHRMMDGEAIRGCIGGELEGKMFELC
jgi:hypothetical protein